LFAAIGSPSLALAVNVSVTEPGEDVVATNETVALAPLARPPRLHPIELAAGEQEPWLGVPETVVSLAGRASATLTPLAGVGPLFVTVTEKVAFAPAATSAGADALTAMSAAGATAVAVEALLFAALGSVSFAVIVAVF